MSSKGAEITPYVLLVLGTLFLSSTRACSDNCADLQDYRTNDTLHPQRISPLTENKELIKEDDHPIEVQLDEPYNTPAYDYPEPDYDDDYWDTKESPTPTQVKPRTSRPTFPSIYEYPNNAAAVFSVQIQPRTSTKTSAHERSQDPLSSKPELDPKTAPTTESQKTFKPRVIAWTIPSIYPTDATTGWPTRAPSWSTTEEATGPASKDATWIFVTVAAVAAMNVIATIILILKNKRKVKSHESNKTSDHERGNTPLNSPPEIIDDHVCSHEALAEDGSKVEITI